MAKASSSDERVHCFQIGDKELEYTLIRSNRKTIGITIDKDSSIKVASPYGVSVNYINQLLIKKSAWIQKKLDELEKRSAISKINNPKKFQNGEILILFGNELMLNICKMSNLNKPNVKVDDKTITINIPMDFTTENIKQTLKKWYIEQFRHIAFEKVKLYSSRIGVFPNKIAIREQKTRWGSCSSKGNINLNWKLIMAPEAVADYVIIHELCHLREMNHSKQFWRNVEIYCPNYKHYRVWLKQNGETLSFD